MIIKIPSTISIDGTDLIENIRINFESIHRFRVKANKLNPHTVVDFAVQQSSFKLDKLSISATFKGTDIANSCPFETKLSFGLIKRDIRIDVKAKGKEASASIKSMEEIHRLIAQLVSI